MQVQTQTVLQEYGEEERAAYLGALASLATADREASAEEIDQLREMAHTAGLSGDDEQRILNAATDTTGRDLKTNLDVLKNSGLRYSLITDLIALAKVDGTYSEEEKANIEKIARYLDVSENQYQVLDQMVHKASEQVDQPQQITSNNLIDSLGMKNQFAGAGFNMGSIGKNLFGLLGPMLLGGLISKGMGGSRSRTSPGGLGGMLGGMLGGNAGGGGITGGLGGMLGGGGGLGSLLNGLNKSRNNNSMGGMLGRLLR